MNDAFQPLQERIRAAAAEGRAFELIGHGSKRFYGEPGGGEPWVLTQEPALAGLRAFEPAELYVTVGAATPLAHLEQQLAAQGQMLGCEPPCIGGLGTVGGGVLLARLSPRLTLRSALLLVVEVAVLLLILYLWRRG